MTIKLKRRGDNMREDLGSARAFFSKITDAVETNETSIEELYNKIEDITNAEQAIENYDYDPIMEDYFDRAVDKIDLDPLMLEYTASIDLDLQGLRVSLDSAVDRIDSLEESLKNKEKEEAGVLAQLIKLGRQVEALKTNEVELKFRINEVRLDNKDFLMSFESKPKQCWFNRLKHLLKGAVNHD